LASVGRNNHGQHGSTFFFDQEPAGESSASVIRSQYDSNRPMWDKKSFLTANLAALGVRQPDLAEHLRRTAESPDLKLTTAKNNQPILIKKNISLHSRHDPEAEGRAFCETRPVKAALRDNRLPVIFGLGLGYHVRPMVDLFLQVVVYEPDPAVIKSALEEFDWADLLSGLTIMTKGDKLPAWIGPEAVLLIHRPSERIEPVEYARLQAALSKRGVNPEQLGPETTLKIMVVTPISGGSLPVAHHTIRALESLGHHVVEADLSHLEHYYRTYREASTFSSRREALGDRLLSLAGEYVSFLAETEKPDLLLALAQAPLTPRVLGRIRALGIRSAFWFVEDYRFLNYFREVAPSYDFFFHIQGQALETELSRLGVRFSRRLPLAADPEIFRPIRDQDSLDKYWADLSFMGAGYPNRQEVFGKLLDHDLKIWGNGWNSAGPLGPRIQENGRRVDTEETVFIFNAAKINLNLHSSVFSSELDPQGAFVNPRTFEIASCGAFQLVDRRPHLERFFNLSEELAVFDNVTELIDLIKYYLARPELRQDMAEKARIRVLAEHTYQHRMETLVAAVKAEGL